MELEIDIHRFLVHHLAMWLINRHDDRYSKKDIVLRKQKRKRRKKHNTRKWTSIAVLTFGVLMVLGMLLSAAGI
jgi:hypothetical protein